MNEPTKVNMVSLAGKSALLSSIRDYVDRCRPGELAAYDAEILESLAHDVRRKLEKGNGQ